MRRKIFTIGLCISSLILTAGVISAQDVAGMSNSSIKRTNEMAQKESSVTKVIRPEAEIKGELKSLKVHVGTSRDRRADIPQETLTRINDLKEELRRAKAIKN